MSPVIREIGYFELSRQLQQLTRLPCGSTIVATTMAWPIANYIDRRTSEKLQNPLLSVLGVAFAAYFAGCELVYQFTKSWSSPNLISVAGDYFLVVLLLGMALEEAYLLARAIRQLQNGGPPPSVS